MDWMKQAEDIFKTWTETQKTMWDEWIKTTQSFGKSQATDSWKRTVDSWEESVNKSLQLQMEWSKLWAESFTSAKGTPKEFQEWARQGQEMMMRWAETQMQLWTAWFDMVKRLDPKTVGGNPEKDSDKFLHLWQENLKNLLNVQAEWGRIWTATQSAKRPGEQAKAEA
jgi:hypothetical protein